MRGGKDGYISCRGNKTYKDRDGNWTLEWGEGDRCGVHFKLQVQDCTCSESDCTCTVNCIKLCQTLLGYFA